MSQRGKYKRVKQPVEDRFFSKVEEVESGCWEWQAGGNGVGYGVFHPYNNKVLAHRWCYEYVVGKIPDGLHLDHLCRNRCCVNPAHLEPVSHRENIIRGINIVAENAAKTHCPKGHEFSLENTYRYATGRRCKTCVREQQNKYYRERKNKANAI